MIIEKRYFFLDEGPTQGSDDTISTAEVKYPINFVQPGKRFVLSLHYNGSNSFLFKATKIYLFKLNYPEIKNCTLYLGNISKDFTTNNMKNRLKESCKSFLCGL